MRYSPTSHAVRSPKPLPHHWIDCSSALVTFHARSGTILGVCVSDGLPRLSIGPWWARPPAPPSRATEPPRSTVLHGPERSGYSPDGVATASFQVLEWIVSLQTALALGKELRGGFGARFLRLEDHAVPIREAVRGALGGVVRPVSSLELLGGLQTASDVEEASIVGWSTGATTKPVGPAVYCAFRPKDTGSHAPDRDVRAMTPEVTRRARGAIPGESARRSCPSETRSQTTQPAPGG